MNGETLKGTNAYVSLEENGVRIKRRFLYGGSEKMIPYGKITAIQFKKPGFIFTGHIQIEVSGKGESVRYGNMMKAVHDENTIFYRGDPQKWVQLRDFLEAKITPSA